LTAPSRQRRLLMGVGFSVVAAENNRGQTTVF
jgi:hypothetical protein